MLSFGSWDFERMMQERHVMLGHWIYFPFLGKAVYVLDNKWVVSVN